MAVYLRQTGWPCELVGTGNTTTGCCTVRLVGGPDDGKTFTDVHYSQLTGSSLAAQFYGLKLSDAAFTPYVLNESSELRRPKRVRRSARRKKGAA